MTIKVKQGVSQGLPTRDDGVLLTATEVAAYLSIPLQTYYRWRGEGKGPRSIKLGKHVRVRRADLEAWLESQADERPPAA